MVKKLNVQARFIQLFGNERDKFTVAGRAMNIIGNRKRTVVSDVSSFVGNPVTHRKKFINGYQLLPTKESTFSVLKTTVRLWVIIVSIEVNISIY